MESTQREEIENVFIEGGFAMNTHQHGGSSANMSRVSKWASLALIATAAAITLFSAAASAADRHENEEDRPLQVGNGLRNAGDAARPATRRADGTFLFESGIVDFSPDRVVVPGPEARPFPPRFAQPRSVGDANYSALVRVDGIVYDAPIIAAAVEDAAISFPDGNPDYALVTRR